MTETLLTSFLLIFIAEMGDKTQLMAMACTARFKASQVILGISAATILNNAIAVIAGGLISGMFPMDIIRTVSYALFICFGIWTVCATEESDARSSKKTLINPFFTVAVMFFLSEFGDKTQIAAMTLAMNRPPVYVLIGASAGMICANIIGISIGVILGKKIPSHIIRLAAAGLFLAIGLIGFWTEMYVSFEILYAVAFEAAIALSVFAALFIILRKKGKNR